MPVASYLQSHLSPSCARLVHFIRLQLSIHDMTFLIDTFIKHDICKRATLLAELRDPPEIATTTFIIAFLEMLFALPCYLLESALDIVEAHFSLYVAGELWEMYIALREKIEM